MYRGLLEKGRLRNKGACWCPGAFWNKGAYVIGALINKNTFKGGALIGRRTLKSNHYRNGKYL